MRESLALVMALVVVTAAVGLSSPTNPIGLASASHECSIGSTAVEITVASSSFGTSLFADAGGLDTDYLGCDVFHGQRTADGGLEKYEQKQEIATRGATTAQHMDRALTSYENQLQNTKSIARSEGLAAYYRALENGSSQAAARSKARSAVQQYYQTKAEQLVGAWNEMLAEFDNYDSLEPDSSSNGDYVHTAYSNNKNVNNFVAGNVTNPGPNGRSIRAISLTMGSDQNTPFSFDKSTVYLRSAFDNDTFVTTEIRADRFEDAYSQIETQNDAVVAGLDSYINETYDSYQAGEIDTTDIIDANTLAREFSPNESFQSWATIRLTQMQGVDPPKNLDQVGYFEISNQSNSWEGLLLSDESPSGGFQANSSYDANNLTGPQYVVTEDGFTQLEGNFSIGNITKSGGENVQNVTYRNVTYNVTDTEQYEQLLNDTQALRAELDARQSALAGGGGFGDIGSKGIAIGILVLGVVFLLGRDTGGN